MQMHMHLRRLGVDLWDVNGQESDRCRRAQTVHQSPGWTIGWEMMMTSWCFDKYVCVCVCVYIERFFVPPASMFRCGERKKKSYPRAMSVGTYSGSLFMPGGGGDEWFVFPARRSVGAGWKRNSLDALRPWRQQSFGLWRQNVDWASSNEHGLNEFVVFLSLGKGVCYICYKCRTDEWWSDFMLICCKYLHYRVRCKGWM